MNRQFVVKMMQAKQLQYEAFKEIMPESMAKRIDSLESDLVNIGKEYFASVLYKSKNSKQETDSESGSKSKTHKVTIE